MLRFRQSGSSTSLEDEEDSGGDDMNMLSSQPPSRLFELASQQRLQEGNDFEALEATYQNSRHQNFQRKWAVALFSIITILLFADQNLMAPNLTAIADDFGFNEQERDQKLGGDIALGFWLLGAPAAIVVGCLADTYNRAILFSVTAAIGEGACLATYFAQTYTQLYICRALTGFALGGAVPLIYSILGDLYPANERHAVSAIVSMGSGLGQTIGQGVAGFLGPTFGWRLPFAIIGLPSLVCALIVFLTVEDPERGAMEEAVRTFKRHEDTMDEQDNDDTSSPGVTSVEMKPLGPVRDFGDAHAGESIGRSTAATTTATVTNTADSISRRSRNRDNSLSNEIVTISENNIRHDMQAYWATFVSLLSNPTAVLSFIQGAPGCVPWGIINTYLNDFLAQDRGMKVEYATSVIFVFSLAAWVGLLVGGAGGSFLYRVDPRYPSLLAGFAAISACFPFWILLNSVNNDSPKLFIGLVAGSAGFACAITGPIVKATVSNVTLPQARGQAFALLNLFDDFGRGLGPVFLAQLIVHLGGRTPAFNVGVFGWALCGILNLLIFFTVVPDERKVQAKIRADLCRIEHRLNDCERHELT